MADQAKVVKLKPSGKTVDLQYGRKLVLNGNGNEELLEILEASGDVSLTIRFTEQGPEVLLESAQLHLKSIETLNLEAKKVMINAEEEATVKSKGSVTITSAEQTEITAEKDVRVLGEKIYLN